MPTTVAPEIRPSYPPPLQTEPRRSGGWLRGLIKRVRLAMAGDDDTLRVDNSTSLVWKVYHDYHLLGLIDPDERREFRLVKHGSLNVRPTSDEEVEYLMLSLTPQIHRVRIYKCQIDKTVEVYDLRAT